MSEVKIIGPAVPNVPWQEKPAEFTGAPVWRYSENPIIGRNPIKEVARIFNSAVIPYEGEFIGVFRGEQTNGIPYIYLGRSKDAIHWNFDENKIQFVDEDGKEFMPVYAYDPRLVKVEDTYYIIWCQDFYGAAIGMAKTTDFKTFVRVENPFLPFNRNAVLFPRKINGNFVMLSRPMDAAEKQEESGYGAVIKPKNKQERHAGEAFFCMPKNIMEEFSNANFEIKTNL